jgi:membrane protein DedA with SNARE-associated domain
MPFAGYLVYAGKMNFWLVGLAGGVGCLWGSLVAYAVGYFGGRPVVERYGKYFLISKHDLEMADKWFTKYGDDTSFWSRLLPIIRTFISLPLGIAKVSIGKFVVYSLAGSILWSLFLVYLGQKFGENWQSLKEYFHEFDIVIGIVILLGIGWYIYRHFVNNKN